MPETYSWISHSISESAAQGVDGAWLARLGLSIFGFAVIWLSGLESDHWGRWGTLSHAVFGVSMLAVALFSHRPFQDSLPFNAVEDTFHSVAATTVGFAFALGVFAVAWRRHQAEGGVVPGLDVAALVASVAVPLGMGLWPDVTGLLQRVMFLIAYIWYMNETLAHPPVPGSRTDDSESGASRGRIGRTL